MRPKFTIRHLIAATGLVAIPCAIVAAVVTADHYSNLALGMVLAGLFLVLLPSCLAIGSVSLFSSRRKRTFIAGVILFFIAWLLLPWEGATQIQQLALLSFLAGLVCGSIALMLVAVHSRLTKSSTATSESNPTRPLLYLVGCIYVIFSLGGFRMQAADPTHLIRALAYLVFAIGTIWLGHRDYDATSRVLTIAWGITVSTISVFTALYNGSFVSLGFVLLVVTPILLIAWRQRPTCTNA